MERREFAEEVTRWYSGGARLDQLTPEVLEALWARYGHLPRLVWKNAIATLLLEPRWPSPERIDAVVGKAEDNEEVRVARLRNIEAKRAARGEGGYAGIISGGRVSDAFGRTCKDVALAVLSQRLKPKQVADLLTLKCDSGTLHMDGYDISAWVEALRAAGDDWGRMPPNSATLVMRAVATQRELPMGDA